MGEVVEQGWAEDVIIAQSRGAAGGDVADARDHPRGREAFPGGSVKHDISVPLGRTVDVWKAAAQGGGGL